MSWRTGFESSATLTRLQGANLQGARLEGANLYSANLEEADLRGAKELTYEQIEKAIGDKTTQVSGLLQRPESWSKSTDEN